MKDSFAEQYKHPKWQELRLIILKRDEFTCTHCKSKDTELHVHHLKYKKGGKLWDSRKADLITLCKPCHERITKIVDTIRSLCWHDGFISSLESLLLVFDGQDGFYIENILDHLRENPNLIHPLFSLLNADKDNASTTPKTGTEG